MSTTSSGPEEPARPLKGWLITAVLALVALLLLDHLVTSTPVSAASAPAAAVVGQAAPGTTGPAAERGRDPRRTRGLFVDRLMPAARAAKEDRRFRAIGKRPQALWITDYYRVKKVRKAVRAYTERANRAGRTPMVALYAIPGRDCGLHSSGGFKAKVYKKWVRQVARGLRGQRAIAVIEPDAVAFLGDCDGQGNRAKLLRLATRKVAAAGAWTYLDAGHHGWHPPKEMARRLARSGIRRARGFSTNVGNFVRTKTERKYAAAVNRQLRKRGIRGKHYVIETARNGAGEAADLEVCNPPHARVGRKPRLVLDGALDGYLWIKHPGESDGPCNGGPASGEWWPEGALRLLGLS